MKAIASKHLAVAGLAVAIALLALALWCGDRASRIQGPSALAVLPDQSVWLSVDDELWRLGADGRLLDRVDSMGALGTPGLVGNLARHPSGAVVAAVRDDPRLFFLDPATGRLQRTLLPQWPADLAQHAARAISYAFSPAGLLAVATGGGHAVALFDGEGRFLARTQPDLYRFTNGLWWQGEALWTTNTNRFHLIELDPRSMAPVQTLRLRGGHSTAVYLGMATPSQGQARDGLQALASVVRFANGMTVGRVVDVFADGSEREFTGSDGTEPRDLTWAGGKLLVVDGASYRVLRFGADGARAGEFGDAGTAAALLQRKALKLRYGRLHNGLLAGGVLVFLAALVLAVRAERGAQAGARQRAELASLGAATPAAGPWSVAGRWLLLAAPVLLLVAWTFPWLLRLRPWPSWLAAGLAPLGLWAPVAVAAFVLVAILLWQRLAFAWAGARPGWEAVVNAAALRLLRRAQVGEQLLEGEQVQDTVLLIGLPARAVVLTQWRLLVFALSATDCVLERAAARADVTAAQAATAGEMNWMGRLRLLLNSGAGVLRLEMGAAAVAGYVISLVTAQRMAAAMRDRSAIAPGMPPWQGAPAQARRRIAWAWAVLASALVPGLGQWMQRRRTMALLLFLPWAGWLLQVSLPLAWTLAGPRAEVGVGSVLSALQIHLLLGVVAAWDAWRMRKRAG